MKKTLYRVGMDFEKFNQDMQHMNIRDFTWYTVVESFVEYHESVSEVLQLLSVNAMCPNNTRNASFLKAVFSVESDMRLEQITPRFNIEQDEYYDKLLGSQPGMLETKMRLEGTMGCGTKVAVELHKETGFTIFQFEHTEDIEPEQLIQQFPSVYWRVLEDISIEEAFWELNTKILQEREQKDAAIL